MLDFSKAGAKEAVVHALKIIVYIGVSGALTALINYFKPLEGSEYGIVFTLINSVLAGGLKWITTKTA